MTALMPSLLFRCFSLFLPHLSTLAQEKRSQNCLRFGTGEQSLCLYQLMSRNIIFSPSRTTAARAKKKILANRFAQAMLTLSASTIEILSTLTYAKCDRTSACALL